MNPFRPEGFGHVIIGPGVKCRDFICFRVHYHYQDVALQLSRENSVPLQSRPIQTIILVDNVHAQTVRLVNFAKSLGHPWHTIHIAVKPEQADR